MPLISLKPPKSKGRCSNRMCNKSLKGPYKILKRGQKGFEFDVCMSCFKAILSKGGPDKYLPGKQALNLLEAVGQDVSTGAELHDATEKPYIPLGTHKLDGEVKIAVNNRTGQIIL